MNDKNFNEIKNKINVKNVATFYQVAKKFNFAELAKTTLCYIERCFAIACETKNFLQLDFTTVAKILASSELHIDSELQVLNAADKWVRYHYKERSKFAKELLLKVRLPLLSNHVLCSILSRSRLSFNRTNECLHLLKQVSHNSKMFYEYKSKGFCSSRYCTNNMFNIVISGGHQHNNFIGIRSLQQVNGDDLKVVKDLASTKKPRKFHQSVYHRGEIYMFGGLTGQGDYSKSVQKYSFVTKTWKYVKVMRDARLDFRVCTFMSQIFIVGGNDENYVDLHSCMKFDTKGKKIWKEIAKMNEARRVPSCSVFEGRIVVGGGNNNNNLNGTNTVEVYDHVADTWSYIPNMIQKRFGHSSVAIKNKLFIIGGYTDDKTETCEVFDSTCNKFAFVKQKSTSLTFSLVNTTQSFSIGKKLIIIGSWSSTALCYDVEKDEFSEEPFEVTKDILGFSCTVAPQIEF